MTIYSYMADIKALSNRSRRLHKKIIEERSKTQDTIENIHQRIEDLEDEVGFLSLMNRVLIDLLRSKPDWNDEEFKGLVKKIDLEDGKQDGKLDTSF